VPRRTRRALALAAATFTGTACRDAATAFAPSPAAAQQTGAEFFSALAARFTNVTRTPKFFAARGKLARGALTPSKILNDTSIWTASTTAATDRGDGGNNRETRELLIHGGLTNGRYVFDARPTVPLPTHPGDSRHLMRLTRLSGNEFEWGTGVDMAVGQLRAESAANVFSALLASAEGRSDAAIRADYRAAAPRTTAALARMFSLDTIRSLPQPGGVNDLTLVIRLHPERLRPQYPAFAAYVEKYLVPARLRFDLRDARDIRWLEFAAGGRRLTIHVRSRDGRMAPLDGPPHPMPDTLRLVADLSTKVRFFTVGARNLVADFIVIRGARERGWLMRFQREPDWRLPFAAQSLLRSPLRRPFAGGGSTLRVAIRDSAGAQTLITRRSHTVVQESAVLRFLGSLGATAMSDYAGKSEAEENRFTAEVFNALRADLRARSTTSAEIDDAP